MTFAAPFDRVARVADLRRIDSRCLAIGECLVSKYAVRSQQCHLDERGPVRGVVVDCADGETSAWPFCSDPLERTPLLAQVERSKLRQQVKSLIGATDAVRCSMASVK